MLVLDGAIVGEAREAAPAHVDDIEARAAATRRPLCVVSSGETTVRVTGSGRGGRNQEFALAASRALSRLAPAAAASLGTDGIDGPTDAAGAIVDSDTLDRAQRAGLASPSAFLRDNDAYSFFDALDDLIRTGPTGTNVGDLQVFLLGTTSVDMLNRDQILAQMRERVHHPAGIRELQQLLRVPRDERSSFKRHLAALVTSGDLIEIRGQRFGLPEKMDLHVGRLQTHPGGYGFVVPERPLDGGDIYVSGPHLNEAMHGDRVVARVERVKDGGRLEGRIIRILERSHTRLVGRYDRGQDGMGYVVPFDRRVLMDIVVPNGQEGGASPGEMVTVELTRWPTSTRGAIGRVGAVLGTIDAPGVDTEIIINKYGIPDAHSPEAVAEAVRLGSSVSAHDIAGRSDFRHLPTVTIDGEHARDFDDAITIERLPNGHYWLGVHIADVSHYVQEGSALDREAYERGTSVYFPERAVHMFPAELATGLCSLNPGVDRLVQSCFMEVDRRGTVVRSEFHDGVITSDERMTYTAVNGILTDRDPDLMKRYAGTRAEVRSDA